MYSIKLFKNISVYDRTFKVKQVIIETILFSEFSAKQIFSQGWLQNFIKTFRLTMCVKVTIEMYVTDLTFKNLLAAVNKVHFVARRRKRSQLK